MSVRYLAVLAFLARGLSGETCLSLSTAAVAPGGTASLDLSLSSSSEALPAAVQWTFQYPAAGIRSFVVDGGPALVSAGKTIMCTENPTAYTCLIMGPNAKTIANGVIAKVTAVLAPDVTTAVIHISNAIGASADGYFIAIASEGGIVISATPYRRLYPPLRRIAGRRCRYAQ